MVLTTSRRFTEVNPMWLLPLALLVTMVVLSIPLSKYAAWIMKVTIGHRASCAGSRNG
jgi:hypothetical protein